jgi:hypothetical protein
MALREKLLNISLSVLGSGTVLTHLLDLPHFRGWLSFSFLILLFLRVMVNRRREKAEHPPRSFFERIDVFHFILTALFLFYLPQIYPRIKGDGVLYYAYLRSFLIDFDLNFLNDFAGLGYSGKITPAGLPANPVFFGCSLLWLPFFLLAHIISALGRLLGGSFPLDGFSPIYQRSITLGSALYIVVGVILIYELLKKRFSPGVSFLSALAVWLASPLFYYMVANPFLAHGVSMFAVTLSIFFWYRCRGKESPKCLLFIGLLFGLAAATRLQNAVFLVIPFLDYGVCLVSGIFKKEGFLWREKLANIAFLFSGFAVPLALQIMLWRAVFGAGFLTGWHTTELIDWRNPHILDMLLSARHGVFTWTPIFFLGGLGLILLLKKDKKLGSYLLTAFVLMLYINGIFIRWWADHSFGNRRMLGGTILFAFGLSLVIDWLFKRPKLLATLLILSLILWNINFATAFNQNLVGDRSDPVSMKKVLAIEGEYTYRLCYQLAAGINDHLAFRIYENFKGIWLFAGPRNLGGVIDIGSEREEIRWELIGNGFSKKDRLDGVTVRFSEGKTSLIRFPLYEPTKLMVAIRIKPIEIPEAPPGVIEISVNEDRLESIFLRPGWNNYLFTIKKPLTKRGLNELSLHYRYTESDYPGMKSPLEKNRAVAVDLLKFVRKK